MCLYLFVYVCAYFYFYFLFVEIRNIQNDETDNEDNDDNGVIDGIPTHGGMAIANQKEQQNRMSGDSIQNFAFNNHKIPETQAVLCQFRIAFVCVCVCVCVCLRFFRDGTHKISKQKKMRV